MGQRGFCVKFERCGGRGYRITGRQPGRVQHTSPVRTKYIFIMSFQTYMTPKYITIYELDLGLGLKELI